MLVIWLKKKTDLNSKITEVEGKTPSFSGLATSSALTTVENKTPYVSSLVQNTNFDAKVIEIKGITGITSITGLATNSGLTAVENKIPNVTSLVTKTDFEAKLKDISHRVTKTKSKHLLVENELKKLTMFDATYFRDKEYFGNDGLQNFLVFQPMPKYFLKKVDRLKFQNLDLKEYITKLLNLLIMFLLQKWVQKEETCI